MMRTGGFFSHAAKEQYVILAPNAISGSFDEDRDVIFIETALKRVIRYLGHEPNVYLIGYNQGAEFATELMTRWTNELSGVGIVGGLSSALLEVENESSPASLIVILGGEDLNLETDGDRAGNTPDQTIRQWSKAMGCSTTVRATIDFVQYTTKYGCSNEARFVYILVGEHGSQWPKARRANELILTDPTAGPYNRRFDAATVIWRFFQSNSPTETLLEF
jgi:poly(3-hydroxybutyrate) depolymerase